MLFCCFFPCPLLADFTTIFFNKLVKQRLVVYVNPELIKILDQLQADPDLVSIQIKKISQIEMKHQRISTRQLQYPY